MKTFAVSIVLQKVDVEGTYTKNFLMLIDAANENEAIGIAVCDSLNQSPRYSLIQQCFIPLEAGEWTSSKKKNRGKRNG